MLFELFDQTVIARNPVMGALHEYLSSVARGDSTDERYSRMQHLYQQCEIAYGMKPSAVMATEASFAISPRPEGVTIVCMIRFYREIHLVESFEFTLDALTSPVPPQVRYDAKMAEFDQRIQELNAQHVDGLLRVEEERSAFQDSFLLVQPEPTQEEEDGGQND